MLSIQFRISDHISMFILTARTQDADFKGYSSKVHNLIHNGVYSYIGSILHLTSGFFLFPAHSNVCSLEYCILCSLINHLKKLLETSSQLISRRMNA